MGDDLNDLFAMRHAAYALAPAMQRRKLKISAAISLNKKAATARQGFY